VDICFTGSLDPSGYMFGCAIDSLWIYTLLGHWFLVQICLTWPLIVCADMFSLAIGVPVDIYIISLAIGSSGEMFSMTIGSRRTSRSFFL